MLNRIATTVLVVFVAGRATAQTVEPRRVALEITGGGLWWTDQGEDGTDRTGPGISGGATFRLGNWGRTTVIRSTPARDGTGFVLERLSKGHVRVWRAIELVVNASNPSGEPRSPTLRRLWEWARTSTHVLHVEMFSPLKMASGQVGVFRVERVDPASLRHVAVIRLCPRNIELARARTAPDAIVPFVRFDGLTEVERLAEVLAHELAHAEYFLESPERLAQLETAQGAIEALRHARRRAIGRVSPDLRRRLREPLAVLAASEAHAESVEAVVLGELTRDRQSQTAMGRVRY
jgi:hypothetical protein